MADMVGVTPEQLASSGTEAAHQTALFAWAALNTYRFPELEFLFHIPNGGTRNKVEAGFLKAQGVRSGVPDIMLPVARWGKHGLFIEMKVKNNKPQQNQSHWIKALSTLNYLVLVCYDWRTASEYITHYLEGDNETSSGCDRAHSSFANHCSL